MRRGIVTCCVCWLAYCATGTNTRPLAYGMTPSQAEAALGLPLKYHSGGRGSEIYVTAGPAGIPGYYPTKEVIALQFRRGRLTGWKQDWTLKRHGPF
jgi:hypothetical protein